MKRGGSLRSALAGGIAGGVLAASAVAVWVAAVFWSWSWFGSSDLEPGAAFLFYVVAPGMLGAATIPVSVGLGAGRTRIFGMFAFVAGAACFVCVSAVEEWMSLPWELVVAGLFALPGVAAFVAVFGFGGMAGRGVPVFVSLFAAGLMFGVVAAVVWGSAEGVWIAAALFAGAWVVFPAVAEAAERGIGGEG